jgi:predicted O-methyltransferase YrrM
MAAKADVIRIWFFQKMSLVLAILMVICSISCTSLHAEWDPNYFVEDTSILKAPDFKTLKERVFAALANSWCSKIKAELLMELVAITRPKVCVEIGAFTGSSVLPVAVTLKLLGEGKIYVIDAWSNTEAIKYMDKVDPNKRWWSLVDMDEVQNTCLQMINNWGVNSYCSMIKKSSVKAVQDVGAIDFLHLDGDYSETGSLQDVSLYLPKVKSGGYILLSNVYFTVNGKQTKWKSFCALFEACDMVCEIETDNTALFRKR